MEKIKRKFEYGSCIPESRKIYEKFKQKGYNPIMVEGWVEIDKANDILPDEDFLFYYHPNEYKKLEDINYMDYPKSSQHTWVEVNGHRIDITKNQFDRYGGIIKYLIYDKYHISSFGFIQKEKVTK